MDPATFATELEILVVRGFRDMGKCARNWMVRNKFIAAQRSCGLRRHLGGVPPDNPIRDTVDRCRVWESHSEQETGSDPGAGLDQDLPGVSDDSREPGFFGSNSLKPASWIHGLRCPWPVLLRVMWWFTGKRGAGGSQIAPLEIMSSLIAQLLRTAQED